MRKMLTAILLLVLAWPGVVSAQIADSDPGGLEFNQIRREFEQKVLAWIQARQETKTADDRRAIDAQLKPDPAPFAARFMNLAGQHPDGTVGLSAFLWAAANAPKSDAGVKATAILENGRLASANLDDLQRALQAANTSFAKNPFSFTPQVLESVKRHLDHPKSAQLLNLVCANYVNDESAEVPAAFSEAADLIVARFAASPDIFNVCEVLGQGVGSPLWAGQFEKHLRTILDQNKTRVVRSRATFALASVVQNAGEARQDEAKRLYEQFVADFKTPEKDHRDGAEENELECAKREIKEIEARGIGKPVPDLAGEDLDGAPIALADFRGKVVLLTFWATWCGPCMRLVPHEAALVERFKDKPFVLVGVNGDVEAEKLKRELEKTSITWRSFKDKQPGKKAISNQWKIPGWPTVYLIDQKGVIRQRWVSAISPEMLEREIEKLISAEPQKP